jgi:nitrite reductase/ring-hydroxylating ferredoxin subunit
MDSVGDGACKELSFGEGDGMLSLIVHRRATLVRAFVNRCPHFSLRLNARPDHFLVLTGERVMCAWHCAVFRLDDGHCIEGPARGMGLDPVPVEARDGSIYLAA